MEHREGGSVSPAELGESRAARHAYPIVIVRLLDAEEVCARAYHGHLPAARPGVEGTARPHVYNTSVEIEQFLSVLEDIVQRRLLARP